MKSRNWTDYSAQVHVNRNLQLKQQSYIYSYVSDNLRKWRIPCKSADFLKSLSKMSESAVTPSQDLTCHGMHSINFQQQMKFQNRICCQQTLGFPQNFARSWLARFIHRKFLYENRCSHDSERVYGDCFADPAFDLQGRIAHRQIPHPWPIWPWVSEDYRVWVTALSTNQKLLCRGWTPTSPQLLAQLLHSWQIVEKSFGQTASWRWIEKM